MIADPAPNLMSRPYRGLSVQEVSFELTQTALLGWITGRNVYRRTEFILVRNGARARWSPSGDGRVPSSSARSPRRACWPCPPRW